MSESVRPLGRRATESVRLKPFAFCAVDLDIASRRVIEKPTRAQQKTEAGLNKPPRGTGAPRCGWRTTSRRKDELLVVVEAEEPAKIFQVVLVDRRQFARERVDEVEKPGKRDDAFLKGSEPWILNDIFTRLR